MMVQRYEKDLTFANKCSINAKNWIKRGRLGGKKSLARFLLIKYMKNSAKHG